MNRPTSQRTLGLLAAGSALMFTLAWILGPATQRGYQVADRVQPTASVDNPMIQSRDAASARTVRLRIATVAVEDAVGGVG
jgi:hypothetical protein